MKDPTVHVFDRSGREVLKFDMSGRSYARPSTTEVPPGVDLQTYVLDWFRRYSPIVSLAAGARLVAVSYKTPDGFHSVIARAATGQHLVEFASPDGLIVEWIDDDRIIFSDRARWIVIYRLSEAAPAEGVHE